ncbi:MAG: hypothetical protein IJ132_05280, partial [Firmicutes bacterium]|nr:hypothetical protein [Bacillota bacterium]
SSVMGDYTQTARYIRNCSDMGIEVLPPNVNESMKAYSIKDDKILFGLRGIKNVGGGAIDAIIEAREINGLPHDIFTFVSNLDTKRVNKKTLESLIRAGATSCLEGNMAQHMAMHETLLESAQSMNRKNLEGQVSMFQMNADEMERPESMARLPKIGDFPSDVKMSMEKEMLGIYLSDNPLSSYKDVIERISSTNAGELMDASEDDTSSVIKDGDVVTICGIMTGMKQHVTKNNKLMGFGNMEDLFGEVELIVFPGIYEEFQQTLSEDSIVAVTGKVNFKEDELPKIIVNKAVDIREQAGQSDKLVKLKIPDGADNNEMLNKISVLLREYRGRDPVIIYQSGGGAMKVPPEMNVNASEEFEAALKLLLGTQSVKIEKVEKVDKDGGME